MFNSSLVYAFSCLLQRLGKEVELKQLQALFSDLEAEEDPWALISLFDVEVQPVASGDYGTWPTDDKSIIKFQYQDTDQPYIEDDNGDKKANMVDLYCVVADAGDHQIIDSTDGVLKNGNIYGNPLGWTTYGLGQSDENGDIVHNAPKPGSTYKVLKGGESGWEIARKLNLSPVDLRDHNEEDVPDFNQIAEGVVLHLPYVQPPAKEKQIFFEFLDKSRPMHVTKAGGTRKFAFNNVKSLKDLSHSGPKYAEGDNVNIFAIAHVPIGDEVAAFYMDSTALGKTPGKVAFTIGYSHNDLSDGHLEKVKAEPKPEVVNKIKEAAATRQAMIDDVNEQDVPPSKRMGSDSLPSPEEEQAELTNYNLWKTTYKPLNEDRSSEVYLFNEDMLVHDLDGRRPSVAVFKLKGVRIAGTFEKENDDGEMIVYGRPQDAMDRFTWYGIPMDDLTSEHEMFNTDFPLPERVGIKGRLNPNERFVSVPLWRLAAKSRRVSQYLDKFKQK